MGRVSTGLLVPGMVLESDVYNFNDQLILPEGLVLNDKAIEKLKYYSIVSVRIVDIARQEEPSGEDELGESYNERFRKSEEFVKFQKDFDRTVTEMGRMLSDVVTKNASIDTNKLVTDAFALLHPPGGDINIFDMVHNMRHYDDITFAHCLNVGLICNVFAGWLGMSEEEQKLATLCGILHDIGKLKIPESVIKKPKKLTDAEYDLIKTHPIEGYKILQRYDLDEHIKSAALMHHERYDGTGYPLGLTDEQIDPYAKIVAIADVYEAMTAARQYRGSLCPFLVLEAFEEEGLQKYDTRMIMTFMENIVNTYMLNRVGLSNGKEGDIVFINRTRYSKPMVRCGREYIDLNKNPDVKIDKLL